MLQSIFCVLAFAINKPKVKNTCLGFLTPVQDKTAKEVKFDLNMCIATFAMNMNGTQIF